MPTLTWETDGETGLTGRETRGDRRETGRETRVSRVCLSIASSWETEGDRETDSPLAAHTRPHIRDRVLSFCRTYTLTVH